VARAASCAASVEESARASVSAGAVCTDAAHERMLKVDVKGRLAIDVASMKR